MEVKEVHCPKCSNKKKIVGRYEDIMDLVLTCPHCHATMMIREVLPPDCMTDDASLFMHPATLVELNTDHPKKYKLQLGEQTIGREDMNDGPDIGIAGDSKMSRQHIHIQVIQQKGYYIHRLWVDANTKNRTLLNDEELEKWLDANETIRKEYKLEKGQTLQLALTSLKILDE